MALTIITNERCFYSDSSSAGDRHLGTRDRFDVSIQYDYPGKAIGCLKAARLLQHRTLPNVLSVEFEGEQTPRAIMERFLETVLPSVRAFSPDVVLWSIGLDSAMGDPIGGLGNLPSSFYTMIRGVRLALPTARHAGLLEGGYDELRWFTCLPPALLALHVRAQDTLNRSKVFAKYRRAFTANS